MPERPVRNTPTLNPDAKAHVPNLGYTGDDNVENVDMDLGLTSPPTKKRLAQLITLPDNRKGIGEESKNNGGTKGIDSNFKPGEGSHTQITQEEAIIIGGKKGRKLQRGHETL